MKIKEHWKSDAIVNKEEYLSKYDDGLATSFGVWPEEGTEPPLQN